MTHEASQEQLREELKDEWTIWVVVAALVSAILGAAATGAIIKICCDGKSGEVTPRA